MLENDLIRGTIGLAMLIGGPTLFGMTVREWGYSDHWAEPLIMTLAFFFLLPMPVLGVGLMIAHGSEEQDEKEVEAARMLSNFLRTGGASSRMKDGHAIMTDADGFNWKITLTKIKD